MNLQTRIPISNGTSIPCVGFGTWKTPNEEAEKSVAEALRVGYPPTLTPRRPTATRLVSAKAIAEFRHCAKRHFPDQ